MHVTGSTYFRSNVKENQDFRVLNVSVSVLSLIGIEIDSRNKKKQKTALGLSNKGSIGSSNSSEDDDSNVKAVVTFFKNSSSSDTFIASHIPSLPIKGVSGSDNRYQATWPTDFDPNGNELSTFYFSRVMQVDHNQKKYMGGATKTSLFIPEEIPLTIGLNKGSDMISLGSASIFLTGEECDDIQFNLPIRMEVTDIQNGKKTKKVIRAIKPSSFPKNKKTKYSVVNGYLKILMSSSFTNVYNNRNRSDQWLNSNKNTSFTPTQTRDISPYYDRKFTPGSSVGAVDTYHFNPDENNHDDDGTYDDSTTDNTYGTDTTSGSKGIFHTMLDSFSFLCSSSPLKQKYSVNSIKKRNDEEPMTVDGYSNKNNQKMYGHGQYNYRPEKSTRSRGKRSYDDQSLGPMSVHSVATQATQKVHNYKREQQQARIEIDAYKKKQGMSQSTQWL